MNTYTTAELATARHRDLLVTEAAHHRHHHTSHPFEQRRRRGDRIAAFTAWIDANKL